ncbi:hypothetical protein BHM03_00056207, partial [Ensete ventricosum]
MSGQQRQGPHTGTTPLAGHQRKQYLWADQHPPVGMAPMSTTLAGGLSTGTVATRVAARGVVVTHEQRWPPVTRNIVACIGATMVTVRARAGLQAFIFSFIVGL